MQNSFVFDKFATEKSFCGRSNEIHQLVERCQSGSNTLLYGRRRYGKTSLIHYTLNTLKHENFLPVYVDLFDAIDADDVAKLIYKACAESLSSFSRAKTEVSHFFKKVTVDLSISSDGSVSFSPRLTDREFSEYLEDAITAVTTFANKENKKVILALDEFQQIALINKPLDATLRKHLQSNQEIVWLFSGSKRHMLSALFFDQSKPLYKQAEGLEVSNIEQAEFYRFASNNMNATLPEEVFSTLYQIADGESKLIQHICSKLYIKALQDKSLKSITEQTVIDCVYHILDAEDGIYRMLDGNLTANQRKALRHIVKYQGSELLRYDRLKNTAISKSSMVSALKSLYDGTKGNGYIIDKDYDRYFIPDRIFELWLLRSATGTILI